MPRPEDTPIPAPARVEPQTAPPEETPPAQEQSTPEPVSAADPDEARPPEQAPPAVPGAAAGGSHNAVSASLFTPDYLSNPPPVYPAVSRRRGEKGKVLLRVLVSADGRSQEVRLHASSGFPRLDRAALDAVRDWRFLPARRGLSATSAWVIVPVLFTLER